MVMLSSEQCCIDIDNNTIQQVFKTVSIKEILRET